MNKRPVSYLQTDARWKSLRLPCTGGTMSLGGGGCGPTSAAMLIETLRGKTCRPTDTFEWCCKHGYMYANQGTAYDYFAAQFKAHGIECGMVPSVCLSASSPVRAQVEKMLKEGYYFIALMKKGLWTNGGHYVVVWWADDKIRINDPASTSAPRTAGEPEQFWPTAKYFWWIDARDYNKEDEDMVDVDKLTGEECYKIMTKAMAHADTLPLPAGKVKDEYDAAVKAGVSDGLRPMGIARRYESTLMVARGRR